MRVLPEPVNDGLLQAGRANPGVRHDPKYPRNLVQHIADAPSREPGLVHKAVIADGYSGDEGDDFPHFGIHGALTLRPFLGKRTNLWAEADKWAKPQQ